MPRPPLPAPTPSKPQLDQGDNDPSNYLSLAAAPLAPSNVSQFYRDQIDPTVDQGLGLVKRGIEAVTPSEEGWQKFGRILQAGGTQPGEMPVYMLEEKLKFEQQLRRDTLRQHLEAQQAAKQDRVDNQILGIWSNTGMSLSQKKKTSEELSRQTGNPLGMNLAKLGQDDLVAKAELYKKYLPPGKYEQIVDTLHQPNADLASIEHWVKFASEKHDANKSIELKNERFAGLLSQYQQGQLPPGSADYFELKDLVQEKKKHADESEKLKLDIQSLQGDVGFKANAQKHIGTYYRDGKRIDKWYNPTTQQTEETIGETPVQKTQDVTSPEQAKARDRIDATTDLDNTIAAYRKVLRPENVGLLGNMRGLVYGAGQQADAFSQLLKQHAASTMSDLMSNDSPISLSHFNDANLSKSELLGNLLAAKYARMMNPTGVISDKDLLHAKTGLGLEKIFSGATDISVKLDALQEASQRVREIAKTRLRNPQERSGLGPFPNADKERRYQEWKAQQDKAPE